MNTTTKRKLIDIPNEKFRILSIGAAMNGTNVKKYIEHILISEADMIEATADAQTYANLLKTDPEGKEYLSKKETLDFEKRLGL